MVKEFTIKCSMEERWIGPFMSMLDKMQHNGNIGHSQVVGLYADGDGDFRPRFKCNDLDSSYERFYPKPKYFDMAIYDADYSLDKEEWEFDCWTEWAEKVHNKEDKQ